MDEGQQMTYDICQMSHSFPSSNSYAMQLPQLFQLPQFLQWLQSAEVKKKRYLFWKKPWRQSLTKLASREE